MSKETEVFNYSVYGLQMGYEYDSNEMIWMRRPNHPFALYPQLMYDSIEGVPEETSILHCQQMIARRELTEMTSTEQKQEKPMKIFRPFDWNTPQKVGNIDAEMNAVESISCDQIECAATLRRSLRPKRSITSTPGAIKKRPNDMRRSVKRRSRMSLAIFQKPTKKYAPKTKKQKKETGHKCNQCSYKTTNKSDLVRHVQSHTGQKPFKCDICLKEFARKYNVKRHALTHGKEFALKCSICGHGFSREPQLKLHETKCTQNRLKCNLCEYVTLDKTRMVDHMRVHSRELPFECEFCAKRFNQKLNLKQHMRVHANRFPFQCSICRQGFSEQIQWNLHENSCKRRRYECYLCHFGSTYKSSLVNHMRIHTNAKTFPCTQCQKQFTRKQNLRRHMKIIHSENK